MSRILKCRWIRQGKLAQSRRAKWKEHAQRRLLAEMLEPRLLLTSVTSVSPLANSHAAPVSTDLTATFDQNINAATANSETFAVHSMQRGQLLDSATTVGTSGATVTVSSTSDFFPGEVVQATVTSAIQSTAGQPVQPHVWQMRTAVPFGSGRFSDSGQSLGNHVSYGVSLGDLDGDGDLDAFVANRRGPNRVWLNNGSGRFSDSGQSMGGNLNSTSVSLGDLDGDGDLDAFETTSCGPPYLADCEPNRVWLNNGSGQFTDSGRSLGNHHSIEASLGDLDGDGDLDVFVANYGSQGKGVWLNNGSGQFSDSGQFLGTLSSVGVSLGDLDGDGDLDALVSNGGRQGNRVWLNNGSGRFSDSGQSMRNDISSNISLGDLDGDGDLDAFAANWRGPNRVWLNNGSGRFSDSGQSLGGIRSSSSVSLGDLDADGDLDAFETIGSEYTGARPSNRVWLNNGSGLFSDSRQVLAPQTSLDGALGDLDGDGDLDAFVAMRESVTNGSNQVWLNQNAAVTLSLESTDPGSSEPELQTNITESGGIATLIATLSVATTRNVVVDLALTGTASSSTDYTLASSTIMIPPGSYSGTATITAVQDSEDEPDETIVVDIMDVTNGTEVGTQQVIIIITDDDEPAVGVPIVTSVTPLANSHDAPVSTDIAVAFDEIINSGTATPQTFAVHSMQRGQLVGSVATVSTSGTSVTLVPTSDFFPGELVQATVTSSIQSNAGQATQPHVWQLRTAAPLGTGVFRASGHNIGDDSGYFSNLALGDLDSDGDLDAFVVASRPDNANRVWLNEDGTFTDSGLRLGDHDSLGISLGDLDGDGDLDAFVANRNQGNRVWINTSGPYSGNLFSDSGQSLGAHFSVHSALGDVDGDGDLDVFVSNYNQPNRIWLNDGAGHFTDSGHSLGSSSSLSSSLGDVDGDGDLDAFVTNKSQSNRVWLNIGGSFTDSGQALGNHDSYGVSLGDVDGDGDLDAFVVNRYQGNRVWTNSAGSFSDSGQTLGDHDSRDVALGDLDGDGDLDAFVANNYQGNRLWLNNGGLFSDSGQSLGSHFSFAVALGDLDEDGDLDAVVANYNQDRVWLNRNPAFSVSPAMYRLGEGHSGTTAFNFTVTRQYDSRGAATVDFAFVPSGSDPVEAIDFSPAALPSGTLIFADGVSSLPVTIEVIGDTTVENDERFTLTLSNPVGKNSVIGNGVAEAVIRNDDNVDLGDLPAPFATLLSDNGPAHIASGPTLGTLRDTESDGQPSSDAGGDNTGVANDEDGVTFGSTIFAGQLSAEVTVTASAAARLDAWIDFNGDRSFDSAGEQVFTSQSVSAGSSVLTLPVPAATHHGSTFARFRLSTAGGLPPTGGAADGEVEDHALTIGSPTGSGVFTDSGQVLQPQDSTDVSLADMDGDGDLDAFVANRQQSNTLWLNNEGVFTDSGQLLGNHDSIDTALGDLDGDGNLDALVANRLQGNRVWLNEGAVLTDSGQSLGDHDSLGISLGDLDGDGDLDAFVANSGGQADRVWFNDSGVFSDSGQRLGIAFSNEVSLGDLDGDGDLDAFVAVGGPNLVWLNEGGRFADSGQSLGDHRGTGVSLGDLDGDGDLDALVTNYGQGNRVWLNDSGQFTDSGQSLGDHQSREVALGDLDGDGDLDAFIANVSDGNHVWVNSGGIFTKSGQVLGDHTSFGVALGDVDGDGDLDAFVADYYQSRVWLNQNATLQVSALDPTTTGFVAEFSQDLNTSALNLYDTLAAGLGPADVILQGASSGAVVGSMVVDASSRKVTFLKTGSPLQADTYTVTLRSAANGFKTVTGDLLDGDGNGVAADDFVRSFTVAEPLANTISLGVPDLVRGPGQGVNLPADSTTGIPVSISDGTNVRAIDLRISYDPALLDITSATVAEGMPAGASVILNNNTPGLAILVFFSSGSLPTGNSTFVNLQATVPAADSSGIYDRQQVLDLHSVTISDGNDNEFPVIADDALHMVSYFADVSGNGRINASDAAQVARFAALIDTGFAGSLLTDPIVVGDISGNGRVNAADASLLAKFAALIPVPEIPPIPSGIAVVGTGRVATETGVGQQLRASSLPPTAINKPAAQTVTTELSEARSDDSASGNDNWIFPPRAVTDFAAVDSFMMALGDRSTGDSNKRELSLEQAIDELFSDSEHEVLFGE